MASSPFVANLVEFFTLKDAARQVDSVADSTREGVRTSLLLSRQKSICAETLWANGHAAEGLALALGALKAGEQAAKSLDGSDEPNVDNTLAQRGLSKADVEFVRGALTRSSDAAPQLDRDVSPAHAELFHAALRARAMMDAKLSASTFTHRDLRWTRISRGILGALAASGLAAGAYFLMRTPNGTFATASDYFTQNPQYAPENVIDGTADTFWLLPDGATGWVEASISPPRHVSSVRVINTSNPPWGDRGTHDYRVEAYSRGAVVETAEGSFDAATSPPADHVINADDVDRVRIVVLSHHGHGGGIAELEIR